MKPMMWMILFLLLPVLGLAYIAWHLWVLLPLSALWRVALIAVGLGAFSLLFLAVGRRLDNWPLTLAQWGYEVGTSSIMVMLYLVLIFLVLDLGRFCQFVPREWLYKNGSMAVALLVCVTAIFVYGNIHYKNKVRVSLDMITAKPLARDYRVVMLSDLHIGYHNTRSELARWVDLINDEHPDFILVAGDIIDGSMRPILEERMAEEFRRLEAPVYACLGNHEYYAGSPEARQFYADAGIHLLSDSHTVIDSCIVLIGRDDRTNLRRKPVSELVASARLQSPASSSPFTLVLDHQPYQLERAEQAGVDFQLSGHTHRGQLWPVSWITDALYECSWGSHQRGHTRYYVSSGLGIWGGKYRIGTQSEYIVATIRSVVPKR